MSDEKACEGLVETPEERAASEKSYKEWLVKTAKTRELVTPDAIKITDGDEDDD